MSKTSSPRSLVEEDSTPSSSPHNNAFGLLSPDDAAVEDAWQEKVQREGIRLEDEPWYMTFPAGIKCRKNIAYYEKVAREDPDPREVQRAQNKVDWGNLIERQVMYAASGERKRISPEAARAREEQFVREMEDLSRRILSSRKHTITREEAGEDNAGGWDAPKKKRCKGKKRSKGKKSTQKTQASGPYPIDGMFR